jgi:hypothetical protein
MGSSVSTSKGLDWATLQQFASGDPKRAFLSVDKEGSIVGTEKPSGFRRFVEIVKNFFGYSELEKVARQIVLIQGEKPLTAEQQKVADKITNKIEDFNNRSPFLHPRRISTALFDSILAPEKIEARKTELLRLIKEVLQPSGFGLSATARKVEVNAEILAAQGPQTPTKGARVNVFPQLNSSPIDSALSAKIKAITSGKQLTSVFVRSVTHTFPGTTVAKPAKVISFQVPAQNNFQSLRAVRPRSVDSLYAAARAIFGSDSKKDQHELSITQGQLNLIVEDSFQDIDINAVET